MPKPKLTQKIIADYSKYGERVLEELDEMLEGGDLKAADLDIPTMLESDFGPNWRGKVTNMEQDALEQVITSGTFNKMIPRIIRTSLREQPKEQYLLLNRVFRETKGECEDGFEDHGVFSDPQVEELCELQKAPQFGVATDFMTHPKGKMRGLGLSFTREALCRDPAGFIQQQVPKIADAHNNRIEDLLLDLFIGYTNTYNRSGTFYDTYYAADGSSTPFDDGSGGPWVNSQANDFVCPEDLELVLQLLDGFRDMVHGRPITVPTEGLTVVTSKERARYIRRKMAAQQIEEDVTCNSGQTVKYVLNGSDANQMAFGEILGYQRFVDRIVLRYGVTAAEAAEWWWVGSIPEFLSWVTNIAPSVTRCPLGAEECQRRIVANYSSLSKGYGYVRNPYRALMLTPVQGTGG